jgi:ribonuclease R
MDIDPEGEITDKKFFNSVIRSKARMTYREIKEILVEKKSSTCRKYEDLVPGFKLMEEGFNFLRQKRMRQGSIDFDLPEPEIEIGLTGSIEDITRAERHVGHMMIEEFMIAANEAVAEFLTAKRKGCIYRVHEPPPAEKIYSFSVLLHNLGYKIKLGPQVPTKKLAEVIERASGKPEERLINTSLLRSMAKAIYSEENIGHYGLTSACYCHFTSPIRRYPDLVVHRLLKQALHTRGDRKSKVFGLAEIAEHCTRRERVAMEAEREIVKLHVAFFIREKLGEEFDGIISHVTKFGFFVELNDFFVEGLVHKDTLPRDRYTYDEEGYVLKGKHKKATYRIGDAVRVTVEEINIPQREIYFALV